jgi:hypothetical protein
LEERLQQSTIHVGPLRVLELYLGKRLGPEHSKASFLPKHHHRITAIGPDEEKRLLVFP